MGSEMSYHPIKQIKILVRSDQIMIKVQGRSQYINMVCLIVFRYIISINHNAFTKTDCPRRIIRVFKANLNNIRSTLNDLQVTNMILLKLKTIENLTFKLSLHFHSSRAKLIKTARALKVISNQIRSLLAAPIQNIKPLIINSISNRFIV